MMKTVRSLAPILLSSPSRTGGATASTSRYHVVLRSSSAHGQSTGKADALQFPAGNYHTTGTQPELTTLSCRRCSPTISLSNMRHFHVSHGLLLASDHHAQLVISPTARENRPSFLYYRVESCKNCKFYETLHPHVNKYLQWLFLME